MLPHVVARLVPEDGHRPADLHEGGGRALLADADQLLRLDKVGHAAAVVDSSHLEPDRVRKYQI